jgi:calcineurin-like phosphoesterase family protein/hemolysin type calcium-binding protein
VLLSVRSVSVLLTAMGVVLLLALSIRLLGAEAEPKAKDNGGHSATDETYKSLVAVGDISSCANDNDEATAKLLGSIRGTTILTLGDQAYEHGTEAQFRHCYRPTWGKYKKHTKPTTGNHDYQTSRAKPYFDYFGRRAGKPSKGYYAYDRGSWHLVALNSNCKEVPGGCEAGSPQLRWLKANLAANKDKKCTLAYMHHPRFSSGKEHGSIYHVQPLWDALYAAGVDVVLSGHSHNYERFAPQDPVGKADPQRGIREFVVGTGGESHDPIGVPIANSEVHNDNTYGVLRLTLHPKSYVWRFLAVEGATFSDSGSDSCDPDGTTPPGPAPTPQPTATATPQPTATASPQPTLQGTDGDDHLIGTANPNTISGLKGADLIEGNAGADTLYGGLGGDAVYGANGKDKVYGGGGNDYVEGGSAEDYIDAGSGDDLVAAKDGFEDQVYCAEGFDRVYVDSIDVLHDCEKKLANKPQPQP